MWMICAAAAAALTAAMLLLAAWCRLGERRAANRHAALRSRYLRLIMLSLHAGSDEVPRFPLAGRPGARMLLAETLADVVRVTYGLDPEPLQRIVAAYRIDRAVLRRVRRSRGYRRARMLSVLAALPLDAKGAATAAGEAARYAADRFRCVRFYALLARLTAEPTEALRLMAAYDEPFTASEVAEVMTLLRRGMLPIAYEPLLASQSPNLRRIGLEIVRQFGIEEAEPYLLRIAGREPDPELGRSALYTLSSMRRPLLRREVAARIAVMTSSQRRALLRHLAREGYSPGALRRLFDQSETPYYESLVESYKKCLSSR